MPEFEFVDRALVLIYKFLQFLDCINMVFCRRIADVVVDIEEEVEVDTVVEVDTDTSDVVESVVVD